MVDRHFKSDLIYYFQSNFVMSYEGKKKKKSYNSRYYVHCKLLYLRQTHKLHETKSKFNNRLLKKQ